MPPCESPHARRQERFVLSAKKLQQDTYQSENAGNQKPCPPSGRKPVFLLQVIPERRSQQKNADIRQNRFRAHD